MDKEADRFGWSVNDWAYATGVSRASVYEIIAADGIESVKFGGKRIITTHPLAWLRSLASGSTVGDDTDGGDRA